MDDGDFVGDSEEEEMEVEDATSSTYDDTSATVEVLALEDANGATGGDDVAISPAMSIGDEDPLQDRPLRLDNIEVREDSIHFTATDKCPAESIGIGASIKVSEPSKREDVPWENLTTATEQVQQQDPLSVATHQEAKEHELNLLVEDDANEELDVTTTGPQAMFNVGDIVHVAARTWPGINKLGGAGKIASIVTDTDTSDNGTVLFLYNVKYMLGGFEKRIEEEFLQYLADALATGVRQHKERVFYHDEYAKTQHKKKKPTTTEAVTTQPSHHGQAESSGDHTAIDTHADAMKRPRKGSEAKKAHVRAKPLLVDAPDIEFHVRSSDDSDYDVNDDRREYSGDEAHSRRVHDGSFSLDGRHTAVSQRKRSQQRSEKSRNRNRDGMERKSMHARQEKDRPERKESRLRKKRSHRIIESDDEDEEEAEKGENERSDRHRMKHKSHSNKRRYIGGYEHGSEDAEGSFIQPEGNPTELPDDVVRELQFSLGTTKAELRVQLETVADRMLANLSEFGEMKRETTKRLEQSASLDAVGLQDVNHKLLELGKFVRTKFIRSGEDVMNLIIQMLEKKGASLPDRIDLQFEDWKQRVAQHDMWVKQSLRALGTTFDCRGFSDAFVDVTPREEMSSEFESSMEFDHSDQDDFEMLNDDRPVPTSDGKKLSSLSGLYQSREQVHRQHDNSHYYTPKQASHPSKKRPRRASRTQTSLDDFAISFDETTREKLFRSSRTLPTVNFRFVRGRDDKILKDPRWDWARTLNRNHASENDPIRSRGAVAPLAKSIVGQKSNSRQTGGSVMAAVLKLRDKRYRDRSVRQNLHPQFRVVQSSHTMPPVDQHYELPSRSRIQFEQRRASDNVVDDSVGEADIVVAQDPRHWKSIFNVLTVEENIPNLQTELSTSFAPLGNPLRDAEAEEEGAIPTPRDDQGAKSIAHQLATIRQTLNTLRATERAEMDRIMEEQNQSGGEERAQDTQCGSWLKLSALADDFHKELVMFGEDLRDGLPGLHPGNLSAFIHSISTELSFLLKQIPDCAAVFGDSPSYAYYFEIASAGARESPLITAICRTYWYSIQVIILTKTTCERCWPERKNEWEPIIADSLSLNRVALACCLFLIDLYIHIPSTHRFSTENSGSDLGTEVVEAPALSLWQSLYEMFSSGTIQSNKIGEISSLWHLLQTAYKQGLVDLVGISFIKRESFGGYIRERVPPKVLDSDADLQGKVLAADVLWDLSCLLGSLFHPIANSRPLVLASSWNLIRQLLLANSVGFVPLGGLPASDTLDQEYQLQAHGFKLRVLRRLLVLSAIWPPESDILEKLFAQLWDSMLEEEDQAVLSFMINFIGEVRQLDDKKNDTQRYTLARQHATRTTNSVELFSKIAVMQLSKLEKAIHRVRFRQPVLRAISARVESNKITLATVLKRDKDTSTVNAPTIGKNETKSWNWGKGDGGTGTSRNAVVASGKHQTRPLTHVSQATPKQIVAEVNSILSIVLMLGVASLYLDEESSVAQQSARRKRELKREIDFFCKELGSVSCNIPEVSTRLCECVSAVGTASLDIGVSYSTPFEHIDGLMKWAAEKLQHARPADADRNHPTSAQFKILAAGLSSCLRALRDLSTQFFEQLEILLKDELEEVESCLSAALGSGLAAMIDAAGDGGLPLTDLDLMIEILMMWMPLRDFLPTSSLQFLRPAVARPSDEFDEFDDPEMMDLLAKVNFDTAVSSTAANNHVMRDVQDRARASAINSLRLSVQRLIVSFPRKRWRSYEELYMMDLLGSMISTCKFPFSWATVSLTSLKSRVFAPRLMASILRHKEECDWFSTSFLSEQNADTELASLWLTATLDLRSLFPTVSTTPASTSADTGINNQRGSPKSARYSSYWLSLTDGILVNLLKEDPVVRYKMDPLMYQLLHSTSVQCSYGTYIRESSDPSDVRTLYSMHVDVFGAFCRSAGHIWQSLRVNPIRHRQDMNRFRGKMMDTQRGVFVVLPEAYEINLRAVCQELDRKSTSMNWYSLSGRFLDEFSAPSGSVSFHTTDDATSTLDRELADPAVRPLIILFKFMYDCVDSLLFNCGGMAIGQQNIFYAIIELMFRQARCAEFPVAEKRVNQASANNVPGVPATKPSIATSLAGISPACIGFTESVRLFFAYQKYPSLINWFAQNLETYQTLKGGWTTSPLRVLLYNVFDPHGPLGIHSYYPMQDSASSQFDPRKVRREAFYVACGLLHCRCTTSYEHTRGAVQSDHEKRRSELRRFVLTNFVNELSRAAVIDGDNTDEYLLPYFQLVKAFLNHLNLENGGNLREETSEAVIRVDRDVMPCLVIVAEYAVPKLREQDPLSDTTSCVILIEFFCILDELVRINSELKDVTIDRYFDVGLRCAALTYHALSHFSSVPLEQLFADERVISFNPDAVLSELAALTAACTPALKIEPNLFEVKVEPSVADRSKTDDYSIGMARVRADLFAVIRRLVKTCNELGGHSLLNHGSDTHTTNSGVAHSMPQPSLPQVSVDRTM